MVKETVDVGRGPVLLEEGTYSFTITDIPEKRKAGKTHFRIWRMAFKDELGNLKRTSFLLFPWEAKDLLLATGGEINEDDKVDWDPDITKGMKIKAEVYHEVDSSGKKRQKLKNVISEDNEEVPF